MPRLWGGGGGITRWAEYIVGYYTNSHSSEKVNLEVLPMNDPKSDKVGGKLINRFYRGLRTYSLVLKELKQLLKNNKYDVLHIATSASISLCKDLLMINEAHKYGIKTVVHFHFGRIPQLAEQNNWEWKLLCKVVQMSDATLVIDETSYNTLLKVGMKNIYNLPNPLSPNIDTIIKDRVVSSRDKRTLLFAGHCVSTKGVCELVEACKGISNIQLKLLGAITPEMAEKLKIIANNDSWLNIMGQHSFEDVIKEMCQCGIFVLPTYTEGFPNVILESMACACPFITTPVGAIPQMLAINSDTPCGICVPYKNVNALRDAIVAVLENEKLRNELSKNAAERARKEYSLEAVCNNLTQIWENIV